MGLREDDYLQRFSGFRLWVERMSSTAGHCIVLSVVLPLIDCKYCLVLLDWDKNDAYQLT